ncbi:hypothetical protein ACFL35_06590 [Candidatus Riflebacteria bacterium]
MRNFYFIFFLLLWIKNSYAEYFIPDSSPPVFRSSKHKNNFVFQARRGEKYWIINWTKKRTHVQIREDWTPPGWVEVSLGKVVPEDPPDSQPNFEVYNRIFELDSEYRVKITANEQLATVHYPNTLFPDITTAKELHFSYELTYQFIQKFDPTNRGFAEVPDVQIDEFLNRIKDMKPIKYALEKTGKSLADFKKVWFGEGNAFEHVFSGEVRERGKRIGGYHWWYTYYRDERNSPKNRNRAVSFHKIIYGKPELLEPGKADPRILTFSFSLDPDGIGKLPWYKKKIGGFSTRNSVAAMMALGHLIFFLEKPRNSFIRCNINGRIYKWVCAKTRDLTSLITLYPKFEGKY